MLATISRLNPINYFHPAPATGATAVTVPAENDQGQRAFFWIAMKISGLLPQRMINYLYQSGYIKPTTGAEAIQFKEGLFAPLKNRNLMHLSDFSNPAIGEIIYTRGHFKASDLNDELTGANETRKATLQQLADRLYQEKKITLLEVYDPLEGGLSGTLGMYYLQKQFFTFENFIESNVFNVKNWFSLFSTKELADHPEEAKQLIATTHSDPGERTNALAQFALGIKSKIEAAVDDNKTTLIADARRLFAAGVIPFSTLIGKDEKDKTNNGHFVQLLKTISDDVEFKCAEFIAEVLGILINQQLVTPRELIMNKWATAQDFIMRQIHNIPGWPQLFTAQQLADNPEYAKAMMQTTRPEEARRKNSQFQFVERIEKEIREADQEGKDDLILAAQRLYQEEVIVYERLFGSNSLDQKKNGTVYRLVKAICDKTQFKLSHFIEGSMPTLIKQKVIEPNDLIEHEVVNVPNWEELFDAQHLAEHPEYAKAMIQATHPDEAAKEGALIRFVKKIEKGINKADETTKAALIQAAQSLYREGVITYENLFGLDSHDQKNNKLIYNLVRSISDKAELKLPNFLAGWTSTLAKQKVIEPSDLIEHEVVDVPNWHEVFNAQQLAEHPDYAAQVLANSHADDVSKKTAQRRFASSLGQKFEEAEEDAKAELLSYAQILRDKGILPIETLVKKISTKAPEDDAAQNKRDLAIAHNDHIYSLLGALHAKGEVVLNDLEPHVIAGFFKKEFIKWGAIVGLYHSDQDKYKKVAKLTLHESADPEVKTAMIQQLSDAAKTQPDSDANHLIERAIRNGWVEVQHFGTELKDHVSKFVHHKSSKSSITPKSIAEVGEQGLAELAAAEPSTASAGEGAKVETLATDAAEAAAHSPALAAVEHTATEEVEHVLEDEVGSALSAAAAHALAIETPFDKAVHFE